MRLRGRAKEVNGGTRRSLVGRLGAPPAPAVTVHLLGTGASVSDVDRTTTMLAFECDGRFFLVDCGADATREMVRAGLDPTEVAAIVLTHEHPDHISGFALLIEKLWLLGRRAPLPIYGPESALRVAEACFAAYTTDKWDGLPERVYRPIPPELGAPVFQDETFTVTAAPVEHPVPTIGLRVEAGGRTVAYSADTARHPNVVRLADGADVLIHEGTGRLPGVHASAEEAAETAREAGVSRLVLVHVPPGVTDEGLTEAREIFRATEWGTDGQRVRV